MKEKNKSRLRTLSNLTTIIFLISSTVDVINKSLFCLRVYNKYCLIPKKNNCEKFYLWHLNFSLQKTNSLLKLIFKLSKFLNKYYQRRSDKKRHLGLCLITMNSFLHAFKYPPLYVFPF